MTKEIGFDLHFTDLCVNAVSAAGRKFLSSSAVYDANYHDIYTKAIDAGLHVRFETSELRDNTILQEESNGKRLR